VAIKAPDLGEDEPGEPKSPFGRSWLAALRDLPAALAATGLALYAILYAIYANFYGSFGLLPEEVGLGYANIFVHSLGLLTAIASCALALRLAFVLYILRSKRHSSSRIRRTIATLFRASSLVLPLVFVVLFLIQSFHQTDIFAYGLRFGVDIRPIKLGPVPFLDIRATPVQIIWGNDATPQQKGLAIDYLLYLGRTESTIVLYDFPRQSILRLPSGSATIVALPCRDSCKPPLPPNLSGLDLQGADLHGALLFQAALQGTNLQGANLQGALMTQANLQEANLRDADLRGAILGQADLRGADLQGVKFHEGTFTRTKADSTTIWPKGFDPRSSHVDLRK
jgi:Pentapeptide repeats (8 copies)